jgi:serine/threonine protein kinase
MDLHCTRPGCSRPVNPFPDLDSPGALKSVKQKYCSTCGMALILRERYVPIRLLGQGGFGAAFLARDRDTPGMRRCVVKQFQPPNTLSPSQLKMAEDLFEREAEALEDLGNAHPLIPDLFAFFELDVPGWQPTKRDRLFYLVQEYIDGHTMEEELAQDGAFSAEAVLKVLREILQVLEFVHDHGSIHRDIKPSNIMRHRKNGGIYLLDFGAVRQVAKAGKSTGIYSEGYAPPEQITGGTVFPSSDLYALAVTCVVLLTGKAPDELFDAHNNTWQWRQYTPQATDTLAALLDRMLLATPSQRFQSASEALAALRTSPLAPPSPVQKRQGTGVSPVVPLPVSLVPPTQPPQPPPFSPPLPTPIQPTSIQPTSIQPAPSQPAVVTPPQKPPRSRSARAPFHLLELLANAGFTGFEGGLLAIALVSVLGTTMLSAGFWLVLVGALAFAQSRRVIERMDLPIIAGVSLAGVLAVGALRQILAFSGNSLIAAVAIALLTGLVAVCLTALFRLVYLLIRRIL